MEKKKTKKLKLWKKKKRKKTKIMEIEAQITTKIHHKVT
jgi:hypothetical protein